MWVKSFQRRGCFNRSLTVCSPWLFRSRAACPRWRVGYSDVLPERLLGLLRPLPCWVSSPCVLLCNKGNRRMELKRLTIQDIPATLLDANTGFEWALQVCCQQARGQRVKLFAQHRRWKLIIRQQCLQNRVLRCKATSLGWPRAK